MVIMAQEIFIFVVLSVAQIHPLHSMKALSGGVADL